MKIITALLLLCTGNLSAIMALTPNSLISRGKPIFASVSGAANLNDGKFYAGNTNNITFSAGSWVAINIGVGPSMVLVTWNSNTWYTWCQPTTISGGCSGAQYFNVPSAYTISTSANSTNGSDGSWTTAMTVSDNQVSARGNQVDFTGKSWVKITFTAGSGPIDEVEVFNTSNNSTDSWFFMGNSITAQTFKGSAAVCTTFATLVHNAYAQFTPAMVRGGIPCIHATQVADSIGYYLQTIPDLHYFAIELGTNDAWGGGTGGLASFKSAMTTIITRLQAAGKEPIVGRICATNQAAAGWQIDPAYNAAVDSLTTKYGLMAGPDFYTYFLAHPEQQQSDGVHPNDLGAQAMQRLWAQKMETLLYAHATLAQTQPIHHARNFTASATLHDNILTLVGYHNGQVSIFSVAGKCLETVTVKNGIALCRSNAKQPIVVRQGSLIRTAIAQ